MISDDKEHFGENNVANVKIKCTKCLEQKKPEKVTTRNRKYICRECTQQ